MPLALRKRCFSPSPNGLDNLDAITFAQLVLRMPAARHDFAVDFDGDAALAVSGIGEQPGNRSGRRAFVQLAIEKNLHPQSVTPQV